MQKARQTEAAKTGKDGGKESWPSEEGVGQEGNQKSPHSIESRITKDVQPRAPLVSSVD